MVSPFKGWEAAFFVVMILSMAVVPLLNGKWWKKWYPLVTLAIAIPAVIDIGIKAPSLFLPVAEEYVAFILLLGALFIVSGGIFLETPDRGRPGSNVLFLLAGAILANVLGTTGASVVLIRPLIRANAWRKRVAHIFVFFIFLVSNIGGLLTPLGDPPLFLGFLSGVPFTWTLKLFPVWLTGVGTLLVLFWVIDLYQYRRDKKEVSVATVSDPAGGFQLHGARNVVLLGVVISSLFLPEIVREGVMLLAAGLSIYVTPKTIRKRNDFTYHPILEVAILFAGIFITMIPLQSLMHSSGSMNWVTSPVQYFWAAGLLSSFLDNAPTYLIFVEAARATVGGSVSALVAGVPGSLLLAISAGCVLMGANTYIGNGPNLMVKAICEDEGIRMPSFLGYMAWSGVILIPLFVVISVLVL